MSLATRCTSCGTIFRIVQDQLKVSEGWVRCGRCDTVFNALEGLFDLERDDPPPHGAPAPPSGGVPGQAAADDADPQRTLMRPQGFGDYVHEATLPMGLDEMPGEPPPSAARGGIGAALWGGPASQSSHAHPAPVGAALPPWVVAQHEESAFAQRQDGDNVDSGDSRFEDARFPADAAGDGSMASSTALRLESESPPSGMPHTSHEATLDDLRPEFVRQADQRAFWHRPAVRTGLALAGLLLVATAGLQAVAQWHDEIAARWPGTRAAVTAICVQVGCSVDAPRDIEQILVESTALARTSLPDAYKLTIVLRNRAEHTLAEPSIDLSLTDVSGSIVARRALAPTEFTRRARGLAPRAESTFELTFAVGNRRVTGYTVAVFYP